MCGEVLHAVRRRLRGPSSCTARSCTRHYLGYRASAQRPSARPTRFGSCGGAEVEVRSTLPAVRLRRVTVLYLLLPSTHRSFIAPFRMIAEYFSGMTRGGTRRRPQRRAAAPRRLLATSQFSPRAAGAHFCTSCGV